MTNIATGDLVVEADLDALRTNLLYLKGQSGDFAIEDSFAVSKSQNDITSIAVDNVNTGAAAAAALFLRNTATINDALRLQVCGGSFTTAGGFVQDSGVISAEANLAGGLNLITRAAAAMAFYTNGHTNKRLEISSAGNVEVVTGNLTMTAGSITLAQGQGVGQSTDKRLHFGSGFVSLDATADCYFNIDSDNSASGNAFFWAHNNTQISGTALMTLSDSGKLFVGLAGGALADAVIQSEGGIALKDGIAAPSTITGYAHIYVDTADGDLKVKFGDGTVKTISVDT